jgi:hypothetical protein
MKPQQQSSKVQQPGAEEAFGLEQQQNPKSS